MAKRRASLKKSATATTTKVGESLSIEKQEEIIQKANLSSVKSKRSQNRATQRLTIDLPIDLHQKLKDLKYDQGIASRGLIISLLRKHFSESV